MKKTTLSLLFMAFMTVQASAQLRDVMMKKMGEKMKNDKSKNGTTTTETKTQENTTTNGENAGSTNTNTNTNTSTNTNNTNDTNNTNNTNRYNPNAGGNTTNPYAGGSGGSKEIRPTYTFSQNVLMEMTKYDSKGKAEKDDQHKMRMYFGKDEYTGMEPVDEKSAGKAFMIMEADKKQMVTLAENEGNKIAMVMSMDPSKYQQNGQKDGKGEKAPTIQKTGRTKKICGYTAEEWVATDEKGEKSEMWVSNDVPIKSSGFYSMFSGSRNKEMTKYFANSSSYPQGFMMEMTHYDSNGEKFTMTTTEVNANAPKTVETAGYTVY